VVFTEQFYLKAKKNGHSIPGDGAWIRTTDSEFKMLNRLANDLKATKGGIYPNITGELKVVSERPYCPSCAGVIQQSQQDVSEY